MNLKKTNNNTHIQAITNAKLLSSDLATSDTDKILNIAIKNQKIVALGYLPDDEDIEEINVCHHLIINNVFNIGCFIKNNNSKTEPNTQLKESPNIRIIDSYELIKQVNDQSLESSPNCYIASVQLSECLFILQEANKTPLSTHCHLILEYIDEETCTLLTNTKLPKEVSIGIYLPTESSPTIKHIETLILSKTISSLSCKPESALTTTIMTYFPNNYAKICNVLFNEASKAIFNIEPISIKIGNTINATFIQKKQPHTISIIISNGVIKTIKGEDNE